MQTAAWASPWPWLLGASPPPFAYTQALCLLAALQLAGALYLHALHRHLRPGLPRLLAAAPVLASNLAAPRFFRRRHDVTTMVLVAFNNSWLSTFKVLMWVLNRGALAQNRLTAAQFVSLLLFPLTPVAEAGPRRKGRLGEAAAPPGQMAVVFLAKMCLLGSIAAALQHAQQLPPTLLAFLYSLALYALLSSIMDGPGAVMSRWLGIRVSPHFDSPWLASSVSSFWSRRWDLAAGNALRLLVYDPAMEGRLVAPSESTPLKNTPQQAEQAQQGAKSGAPSTAVAGATTGQDQTDTVPEDLKEGQQGPPPPLRQVMGTAATFLASGAAHECIFWFLTGSSSGGRWLAFFLLQVPVVVVERAVLGMLRKRGVTLPRPLLTCYTIVVECWLSARLFWAPVQRTGVLPGVLTNVEASYRAALRSVIAAARRLGGPDRLLDLRSHL